MKIPCPACAAKYSVADEKIQSRLAKIRCRKCGVTIVIDGTVTPANVYVGEGGQKGASASSPSVSMPARGDTGSAMSSLEPAADNSASEPGGPAPNEYAVDIADNDQRNMTLERIVAAYNSGVITAETYIWKEGMADWQMLAEVPEVYNAIHSAARASGLPPGGAFGRQGEMFGGAQESASEPPLVAGTGARNESSVLFSLSALTGTGSVGAAMGGERKPAKRNDDSGLIDLQALTAQAESPAPFSSPNPVTAFSGPALISAPLGGVTSSTNGAFGGYAKPSSGKGLFIGGAMLLLAVGASAVVFMMQGGDPAPVGTVAVAEDKAPLASNEEAPRAAAQPEAEQESERAAGDTVAEASDPPEVEKSDKAEKEKAEKEDSDSARAATTKPVAETSKPTPVRHRSAPAPRKTKPASAPAASKPEPVAETPKPAAAAPAPAPEPKKKKACDCKPADLMCAMRCSAAR